MTNFDTRTSTRTITKARTMLRAISILFASVAIVGSAHAQDLTHKAPVQDNPIAIVGGTVHTISGETYENGYVTFDKGVITGVGEGRPRNARGAEVIDATGMHIYPGLVAANTQMGLVEIGAVRATLDYAETASVSPEVRAAVSVNPDSTVIPVTRLNGILTCGVFPLGGLVPGRASVIRMDGWTWEDLTIKDDAGLVVNWPSLRPVRWRLKDKPAKEQRKEATERVQRLADTFEQAEAYLLAKDADGSIETDIRWESMRPYIIGGNRFFVRANELEQIQSAVAWASEHEYTITIMGGRDAHLCTDLLVRHGVGVIVTGTHRLPKRRDEVYDAPFTLPAQLEEAGVSWCLATTGGSFNTPHERNLPYHAGTAVGFGLTREAAMRSITLSAAELLGVGDSLGSLDEGKAATLIITDGDPLEIYTTTVLHAFIDGRSIELTSKQTKLAEKYRAKYRQLGLID